MTTFSNIPLPSIVDDPLDNNTLRYPNQLTPTRSQFFVEMIRMSKILEQIISRVYQPWRTGGHVGGEHSPPFSLETVNELDAQLSQFEKAVPWPLNWATGAGVEMSGLSPDMGPLLRMQKNVLRARYVTQCANQTPERKRIVKADDCQQKPVFTTDALSTRALPACGRSRQITNLSRPCGARRRVAQFCGAVWSIVHAGGRRPH
jgi:hypothetical protein